MDQEMAVEPVPIRRTPSQDEKQREQQQGTLPAFPPHASSQFTIMPALSMSII
jgi:hypothetical protein